MTDFATGDVTLGGTAGATTGTVTGSGTSYNIAVSGMTTSGTVTASIAASAATDSLGNPNGVAISTDNTVTFSTDTTGPTVTINQAAGQGDPTNASPINFTVLFSEVVTDFATGDVTLGGTAGATTGTVTGSGTTYNISVTGMATDGTVTASLAAGVATDSLSNPNDVSTSTDNSVTFSTDTTGPSVTINQAAGQDDPTNANPINFTVIFSEVVNNFTTGDVTIDGTAGPTTGTVTGSGTTYNVAVSGITTDGTVIATIAAGVATDSFGNPNSASTSTDNTVTVSTPSVLLSVSNLSVSSGQPYQVIPDGLQAGATVYIDRTFTFVTVPAIIQNATYLQTANNDKNSTGTSFVAFEVNQPVTVYVGHDTRITTKPTWLNSFSFTGDSFASSDTTFDLYRQDFPAGLVTLGGNQGSGRSMYTVAVVSLTP